MGQTMMSQLQSFKGAHVRAKTYSRCKRPNNKAKQWVETKKMSSFLIEIKLSDLRS
ncbi:hypothetical protein J591_0772 [Acinetobacter baumannii 532279]|uniref:hypothetical protein n=1 Tax=Acinetobacter baumannii TaxID=470 RepID=UPI000449A700|nr:hypothetical protein [Acinetobacter baumannii]EXE88945.1 hypothetical protein J591_0772 [Acinetobacter baumannii 532279]